MWKALLSLTVVLVAAVAAAGEKARTLTCTGLVTDISGKPVPGASVRLFGVRDRNRPYGSELFSEAQTGADGAFTLETSPEQHLDYFSASVVAAKEGFALGWSEWPLYDREDFRTTIVLGPPRLIAGKVADTDGQPVSGAVVRALLQLTEDGRPKFVAGMPPLDDLSVETGGDGYFAFDGVPADARAAFIVSKEGFQTYSAGCLLTAVPLPYSASETDITLRISPESKIEGRVVAAGTGEPLSGARLRIAPKNNPVYAPFHRFEAVSGEDGAFAVGGLGPHEYAIDFLPAEGDEDELIARTVSLSLEAGETRALTVEVETTSILEVRVQDEMTGEPLGGADVALLEMLSGDRRGRTRVEMGDTDGISRFTLSEGHYVIVSVSRPGYQVSRVNKLVALPPASLVSETIPLVPMDSISGVVLDPGGKPFAGARVEVGPGSFHPGLVSDENGRFTVPWKTPTFADKREVEPYVVARVADNGLAVRVPVYDMSNPVEVTLTPGADIRGRILYENGQPVHGAAVMLFWKGDAWTPPVDPAVTFTDEEGRWAFAAVPDGFDYEAHCDVAGYGLGVVHFEVRGKAGGSVEVADLALVPADKSISGTVVDGQDEPVARAQVRIRSGTSEIGGAVTDESGAFLIENLTAGKTTLRAVAVGPLVSEYVTVEAPASDVKLTVREYDKQTRAPVAAEAKTLTDKALPDLAEISAEFVGSAEGKPVLICWFDFTLRGSRRAVTQLAARAAELEEAGVAALAVDVSGTAPEELNDWAAGASIPFGVVGIGENAETRRLEWGVKGLPWFVLADKEHIVRAEGFGTEDLDAKIAALHGE